MHTAPVKLAPLESGPADAEERAAAGAGRTPWPWRGAAAAVLVGGVLAGDRLSGARPRRVARVVVAVAAACLPLVARAARRGAFRGLGGDSGPPVASGEHGPCPPPSVTVVIPARDEAAAIPRLIADLGAQDLAGAPVGASYSVVVIDDRSRDGTGEVACTTARCHGLEGRLAVVRRHPGASDGKGAALGAVPQRLLSGDSVVVLDADARVDPTFVRRVVARLAAGDDVFTARRRVYNAAASPLAAAQAAELELDGLQLRARLALGGAGELRGNGMVLRSGVLADAGGWPPTLTEDLDLSTRLAGLGRSVGWAHDLVVWEAPTATWRALARQRLRWAEGSLRRLFALLPWAVGSPRLSWPARIDLIVYAGQAILPPVVVGAVGGGLRRRRGRVPLLLVGTYAATATFLTAAAVAEAGESPAEVPRPLLAVLGGVFACQWLIAVPAALLRIALRPGPVTFDRTAQRLL